MNGAINLDHLAIPATDGERSENFYMNLLGLKLQMRRYNPNGRLRQTYLLLGNHQIGLFLPGIHTSPSESWAPRYAFAVPSEEEWDRVIEALDRAGVSSQSGETNSQFVSRSAWTTDPDGNHIEICLRRMEPSGYSLSHVVLETESIERSIAFYTNALGMKESGETDEGFSLQVRTGQHMILKAVPRLSKWSRTHGRGCHLALDIDREDFEEMVEQIPAFGGKLQGDPLKDEGRRAEGEKNEYLSDPDGYRLQIQAHSPDGGPNLTEDVKWANIQSARSFTRWERE